MVFPGDLCTSCPQAVHIPSSSIMHWGPRNRNYSWNLPISFLSNSLSIDLIIHVNVGTCLRKGQIQGTHCERAKLRREGLQWVVAHEVPRLAPSVTCALALGKWIPLFTFLLWLTFPWARAQPCWESLGDPVPGEEMGSAFPLHLFSRFSPWMSNLTGVSDWDALVGFRTGPITDPSVATLRSGIAIYSRSWSQPRYTSHLWPSSFLSKWVCVNYCSKCMRYSTAKK